MNILEINWVYSNRYNEYSFENTYVQEFLNF